MAESLEDETLFCIETSLRLACGEEVTLIKQASEFIKAFGRRDSRIWAGCTLHDERFSNNAIAAYRSVFKDFLRSKFDVIDKSAMAHEIYNGRMYGPWWENGPSGLKDFSPKYNESYVSRDFVDFEFLREVYPARVSVIELCNPGSIIGIWGKDQDNRWRRLWSGSAQRLPDEQRVFSPSLDSCNFRTSYLRLELDYSVLDYCAIITGVFLIGTSELIVPCGGFEGRSLGTFLKDLRDRETNAKDPWNLTPDLPARALNEDLLKFEKILHENCMLYRRYKKCDEPRHFLADRTTIVVRFYSVDNQKDEILLKILRYSDLRSLCRCSQVNRRFRCVTQDASLYTSLNLKSYWYCTNVMALKTLSSRCKYLHRLDISWCGSDDAITPEDFKKFLRACGSRLTHLRLYCCDFVDDSVVEEISSTCTDLKGKKYENGQLGPVILHLAVLITFPRNKGLGRFLGSEIADISLALMAVTLYLKGLLELPVLPAEIELCLCGGDVTDIGFGNLKKLQFLERFELYRADIQGPTLCSIIQKNPQIRHLNITELIISDLDSVAVVIADSCPNLESIVFWYTSITTVGIRALARCTHLREVDFGYCRGILRRPVGPNPKHSLRTLFARCDSLEKVVLTGMTYLTDEDLEPLLFGPIRQLHVGGAKWLSPEMCSRFFLLCPQLQMIDLNMCYEINDAHIEKWHRLYPHVSIKWSSTGTLCTSIFL